MAMRRETETALGLAGYLLFVVMFTQWFVKSRDANLTFVFGQIVRRLLLEQLLPSSVHTAFKDVASLRDAQAYLRGPFLAALFDEQLSYATDTPLEPRESDGIDSQSRLLGAVRIRQVRVATNSCAMGSRRLSRFVPTCYPSLTNGNPRVAPFYGIGIGGVIRRIYRYTPAHATELPFAAAAHSYGGGGFVVDMPSRRRHAEALLHQMESDGLYTVETRAIFLDFSLYNANINTFCFVKLTFEVHPWPERRQHPSRCMDTRRVVLPRMPPSSFSPVKMLHFLCDAGARNG